MNTLGLILTLATIITGIAYVYDYKVKRKLRLTNYAAVLAKQPNLSRKERKKLKDPDYFWGQMGALFPIILFVFLFRSFFIEPFKIPSGSMMPTLLDGDFIAVTKWSYGFRDPIFNQVIIPTSLPKRGDVVVFKYPEDPSVDFIKRIVGLPGDTITYRNKNLYIKEKCEANTECKSEYQVSKEYLEKYSDGQALASNIAVYKEKLAEVEHQILNNLNTQDPYPYFYKQEGQETAVWVVPEGHYFALGDNRDNSRDSRFWGFVPEQYLVGKTIGIWLSLGDRGADSSLPSFIPTFRFERLGGID